MSFIYSSPNVLANGAIINGFCHFYQSSKPTTRLDGSALVFGDKWYNTSTGVEGLWNGTYWLGSRRNTNLNSSTFNVNASGNFVSNFSLRNQLDFLESIEIFYTRTTGSLDANNRYDISFRTARNDNTVNSVVLGTFSINQDPTGLSLQTTISPVILINEVGSPLSGFVSVFTAIGTPGGVRYLPIFYVRSIL